MAAEMAGRT
ncbi:hypothetical protein VCHC55A1_2131, partial [Vibrio cholerae HC-55A1]